MLGLTGCAAGQLALAAATDLTQAVVTVVFLGLVFEVYEPPSQAMVADVVAPADRPAAYGLLGAAMAVAGVASGLLATVLGGVDLRLLFVADAATCLAAAGLVWRALPRRTTTTLGAARSGPVWRDRLLLDVPARHRRSVVVRGRCVRRPGEHPNRCSRQGSTGGLPRSSP